MSMIAGNQMLYTTGKGNFEKMARREASEPSEQMSRTARCHGIRVDTGFAAKSSRQRRRRDLLVRRHR